MSDNLPVNSDATDVAAIMSAMPPHNDVVSILGVMIPIIAIVMGLGLGMLKSCGWTSARNAKSSRLHHAERMAAIEKGIELPPLPPEFFGSETKSLPAEVLREELKGRHVGLTYLRSGLIWLLVGIAISVALYTNHDGGRSSAAWWGGIPIAFGLSKLLFYFIANRMNAGADAPGSPSKPKE